MGARWGHWVAIAVVSVLVVVSLGAYTYYRVLDGQISREAWKPPAERPPETGALNVLLIGSDSREGSNKKYGATTVGAGERSDTLMMLHVSPDRDKVTLISFPRDLMVVIPQCGNVVSGIRQINSAFNDGGVQCAMQTVESVTKLRLDHFVKVDFTGFKGIVDALGGISICLPKAVNDPKAKLVLPAGKQVVNGEQALGYVRARYTLGDGSDLSRIKRQQVFLSQVMKKVTSGGILADPGKLNDFLLASLKAVVVDEELSMDRMLEIGRSVQKLTASQLKGVTVPVEAYPADKNRVQLSQAAAEEFFGRLRNDTEVSAPLPTVTVSQKAPVKNEQVRVQVLNGSGKPGLAKQVADELAAQQFVIVGTGNATPTDKTSIRYAKSLADGADYADVVAGRLSKEKKTPVAGKVKPLSTDPAPAQKGGSGPIVQLVIGADWPGVRVSSVIPDALKDKTVDSTTNPCL